MKQLQKNPVRHKSKIWAISTFLSNLIRPGKISLGFLQNTELDHPKTRLFHPGLTHVAWTQAKFLSGIFDVVTSVGHSLFLSVFPHFHDKAFQSEQYKKWWFLPPTHISLILDETYYIKGSFNVCKLFHSRTMHSQVFLHISMEVQTELANDLFTLSHILRL